MGHDLYMQQEERFMLARISPLQSYRVQHTKLNRIETLPYLGVSFDAWFTDVARYVMLILIMSGMVCFTSCETSDIDIKALWSRNCALFSRTGRVYVDKYFTAAKLSYATHENEPAHNTAMVQSIILRLVHLRDTSFWYES